MGEVNPVKSNEKVPSALDKQKEILHLASQKDVAIFLDYDGTLTKIVPRPEDAVLDDNMRRTVRDLANYCTVAVISGRDLKDVQHLVALNTIFYAGSHGFDISGPEGQRLQQQKGNEFLPVLDRAEKALRQRLEHKIQGVQVERKKYAIAVHYRRVQKGDIPEIEKAVDQIQEQYRELRKTTGKKIFELQPDIDWNKGKALLWLLEQLGLDRQEVLPFYLGDDVTDEDAFKVLQERGVGIAVQDTPAPTAAEYRLQNPEEVEQFLTRLITVLKETRHE
jgi:trehalose 6-phosphate phosphatase